jgi:hypothetical protein
MRPLLLAALLLFAPQERPAAPPLPDEKERLAPGLSLGFEAGGVGDVRSTRLAAFTVPEGMAPSPFLPPGPFKAVLEGFISVDLGTDCTFSAQGRGSVSLTVNGKPALEAKGDDLSAAEGRPVRLRKGRNPFVARYESPPAGEARLRLSWASADFPLEPVGPLVTSHDVHAPGLRARRRLREGRELVASRRCLKCHADPVRGMPELEMDAPSLEDAGARLRAPWMEAWIAAPRSIRPEATMPHLPVSPQDAADLAAHLATLGKPAADPAPAPDAAAKGGQLFAELRCIACHTLPEKEPAPDRIPLRLAAAKWRPAALVAFLKSPQRHYAWIEMPDFALTDAEAGLLAAFLLSRKGADAPASGLSGDPARGAQRLQALGCLACHKAPGTNALKAPALRSIPAAGWSRGCMAEKPAAAPDFGFAPAQREALVAFAATDLSALSRDAAPEFLERQVRTLRCQACHKRDQEHDLWADLQGETKELLPKKKEDEEFQEVAPAEPYVPPLTWTGEKLKPEWTAAFLAGTVKERPRPYLGNLRMPSFPSRAAGLAAGFALAHGSPAASLPEPAPEPALSEIGRRLAGPHGGLDCLACHGIGPKAATKVFEGPGPNFRLARERLRREYVHRWISAPLKVEPGTKMPQFFEEGRSKLTEILDGDASKQIEALWNYLLEGGSIRPPGE